ncbi:Ubiquitin carboxyl-terminal hydrolase 23 [Dichanthelium oligosanthes]|uniref:Ubiquitin carboxyl-terminal hydrolase n=1 Tax=Dichanthelium oligosanthes TaxID=888268 RepID=A0A1E5UTK4_9POAL|nr:Ubiquitin carboxyl-terminal hydrolase 23 [Dichanthelium oligosanthes]
MAEVSTAAAPEGVLHRRIDFHLARRPHTTLSVGGGGFRMETLNPDAAGKAGAGVAAGSSEAEARRPEKGDAGGIDPELSVARIYLGRIGAGLQNLGNTCYLNSVLQCLTYTEPFAAYLQSGKHKSSCKCCCYCQLVGISRSFRNSRQEDAHELMVNLLESMHKCCLPSGVPSESQSAYDKSLVHKIFGGRLRSQVKCTRCSHCSNKFDPFLDLSLDIAKATTLVRALQNFTEEELLDGGQKQYQCERCRQKVVAKKRFTIDKAPNVLTVHLKRFSPFNPREKIDKKVDFQPVLDLKPFVSDSKGTDFKYSLYGVLVHAGWNTQSGHYYCFVRTSSGMWHNLDDNQVRQVREADVLKQKAYMLFYVRDSIGNSVARKDNSTANLPTKKTPEKISTLNGITQGSVKAQHLNGSSPFGDKVHSTINGYSSIFGKTSADHFSKNGVKAEDAAASQSNGLPSTQALGPQNDGVTLPAKSMQCSVNGQKETSSSHQSASFANTCGKQTVVGRSLQELEPKTDVGKNTSIASPMVNDAGALSKADKLTSKPQTPFSKPTAHINDTSAGLAAETSSKKDSIISNVVMPVPGSGSLTSSEKAKDLPGTVEQANDIAKALPVSQKNTVPELAHVVCGKQISSGGSVQVAVAASCNGTIAKKVNVKSKKFVRYPVVNMWLGSRKLLATSLKPGKKAKHKRARRRAVVCKDVANISCLSDSMNEQLTSTSATAQSGTVECTTGHRKCSHASARPENDTQSSKNKQKVDGACVGTGTSAPSANSDIQKSGPSSSVDQMQSRKNVDAKLAAPQPVSIRASDLMEATVPSWDDVDMPNTKVAERQHSKRKSIGYVLDEWDEDYDRGKTKKVRNSKQDLGGTNPFQEEANYISQRRLKQKCY